MNAIRIQIPVRYFVAHVMIGVLITSGHIGLTPAVLSQEPAPATELTAAQQEQLKQSELEWQKGFDRLVAGDRAGATDHIKAATTIERSVLGDEHDRVLTNLPILADLYEVQEKFSDANAIRTELVAAFKKKYGADHWQTVDQRIAAEDGARRGQLTGEDRGRLREAAAASAEVNTLIDAGKFAEALKRAAFVVERRRELIGEKNSTYALSLAKQASIHTMLGDFEIAESFYEQALTIEQETLGEQHPEYAKTLSNLAVQCDELGQYQKAEKLYEQAAKIKLNTLGRQSVDYATSLNNLAVHYDRLGDFEKAEAMYLQSIETYTQTLGANDPETLNASSNYCRHLLAQGELSRAEPILLNVIDERRQSSGEQDPQYAESLNALGILYAAKKDFSLAIEQFQKALAILKQVYGDQNPGYLTTIRFIADVENAQGKFSAAESHYQEVLEARRLILGKQHPDLATTMSDLSLVLLHQEKYEQATALALEAAELRRQNDDAVSSIQSERQQFSTTSQSHMMLDALLTALAGQSSASDAEYNEVLQLKGRVLQRQRRTRGIAQATASDPQLAKMVVELRSITANRAHLALNVPSPENRDAWRKQMADTINQQEQIERDLSEKSEIIRQSQHQITPAELRSSLPEKTVLVDVIEYLHVVKPPVPVGEPVYEKRLAAFIVRRDVDKAVLVHLGAVEPIATAIDVWRESYGESLKGNAAAESLKKMIWGPLAPHLSGSELVLFSPDGALGRFPLGALPGKSSGSYLLEEIAMAIIPYAAAIPGLLSNNESTQAIKVAGDLLVVGNIDYDSTSPPKPDASGERFGRQLAAVRGAEWKAFPPLSATRGELASIIKLHQDKFGLTGLTVLEGTEAREERFCDEAVRHRFVHVATHGFFAPPSLRSALQGSDDAVRSASVSEAGPIITGYPPGLLSGLALAGANLDPEPNRPDGILTASEVENLDLRGVQVAVLSACETGLGDVAGGEGLLGIQRAFQVAGAQAVVASLWQVSDTATRTLMERFYDNMIQKKMGTLEALREAQLWMLREEQPWMLHEGQDRGLVRTDRPAENESTRTSPFFWAAFVLSGDWR